MRRFLKVRLGSLVLIPIFMSGSSLALTGCNSGSVGSPVDQAKAGQEVAKSSMDYMRKHVGEAKGAARTKAKNRIPTH